ncbi:MAG TPA: AI-2E family transporter, partial [Pirellulales bacterium]|nr:AI-2E family transporter [Pirellulales bacterium]
MGGVSVDPRGRPFAHRERLAATSVRPMTGDNIRPKAWTMRSTAQATLAVTAVALFFGAAWACRTTLLALFAGIVCATAIKPLIGRLARIGLPNVGAVFVAYLLAAAVVAAAVLLMLPILVDQLASLLEGLPDAYQAAREHLLAADSQLVQRVAAELPASWPSESLADSAIDLDVAKEALAYGRWLFEAALVLGAIAVFAFSW